MQKYAASKLEPLRTIFTTFGCHKWSQKGKICHPNLVPYCQKSSCGGTMFSDQNRPLGLHLGSLCFLFTTKILLYHFISDLKNFRLSMFSCFLLFWTFLMLSLASLIISGHFLAFQPLMLWVRLHSHAAFSTFHHHCASPCEEPCQHQLAI